MNIYVGNLPYSVTEDDLREVFGKFGQVSSASLITDKFTGQSKGFGFVEMPSDTEGQAAVDATNGADLGGRAMKVNEAKPRDDSRRPQKGRGSRD